MTPPPPSPGAVLIAGAGYVGAALARLLASQGRQVYALRRTPTPSEGRLTWIAADLTQPHTLTSLPPDITHLVYAAAADGSSPEAYRAAYDDGPRNLLHALQHHTLHRALYTSSTSLYTQSDGAWVTEDDPAEATGPSSDPIRAGEAHLRALPCPTASVRFGGIYGPQRTRLIDEVRAGTAAITPGQPLYTNRIHRDDCAHILAFLLDLPDLLPLYNGVDAEPTDRADVLRWLAQQLHAPQPPLGDTSSLTARALRSNKRVSSQRLQSTGYTFLYPSYREGYASLL